MHYYIGKRTKLPIVGNVYHGFSFYISKHVWTIIYIIGFPFIFATVFAICFFINHFVAVTSVILLIALIAASIKQSLNGYTLKEWIADRLSNMNDDEEPKQKKEAPADYYKYSKPVFNFNGNNDSFMR